MLMERGERRASEGVRTLSLSICTFKAHLSFNATKRGQEFRSFIRMVHFQSSKANQAAFEHHRSNAAEAVAWGDRLLKDRVHQYLEISNSLSTSVSM